MATCLEGAFEDDLLQGGFRQDSRGAVQNNKDYTVR